MFEDLPSGAIGVPTSEVLKESMLLTVGHYVTQWYDGLSLIFETSFSPPIGSNVTKRGVPMATCA